MFPALGAKSIRAITAPMVLTMIRNIEKRGALDMAHRVRNHVSDVFVWAIASGLAEADPAALIRKALAPTDPKLRPAMVKITAARELLTTIEALPSTHWSTLLASRLLALTAARPGVVRLAERQEFEGLDGPSPIWRIPAEKMKLTRAQKRDITWEFVVPLSRQAAAVAKAAISESLACRAEDGPSWLFSGTGGWRRPLSDSTLSKLYRDAGFTGLHVPHGWRSTFSTIMNERAALEDHEKDRAIIDLMLAHTQQGVEPVYNRAERLVKAATGALLVSHQHERTVRRALASGSAEERLMAMYGGDLEAIRQHKEMLCAPLAPTASAKLALYPSLRIRREVD